MATIIEIPPLPAPDSPQVGALGQEAMGKTIKRSPLPSPDSDSPQVRALEPPDLVNVYRMIFRAEEYAIEQAANTTGVSTEAFRRLNSHVAKQFIANVH